MAFNWKDLFIVNENPQPSTPEAPTQPITTPQNMPSKPAISARPVQVNATNLNDIVEVYEKGFAGLNKEGYDFFEMYQAIMTVGNHNLETYKMALAMGKAIQPNLTRDFLLQKANEYITEIEKVHQGYAATGSQKRNNILQQLESEKGSLTASIATLEKQLAQINTELSEQKTKLSNINSTFEPAVAEIEQKIAANDNAKNSLLQSINQVISGIKQYL